MYDSLKRFTALLLSFVLVICSNTGFGGRSVVYADEQMLADVDTATPGDGRIDASQFDIEMMGQAVPYEGDEINRWLGIYDADGKRLIEDIDYTVSYTDNIFPGTARINITYIGRYKGSAEKLFKITQARIEKLSAVSVDESSVGLDWRNPNVVMDRYVVMRYGEGSWKMVYSGDASYIGAFLEDAQSPNTVYKFCVKGQRLRESGQYVDVARSSVITVRTKPYDADFTEIKMSKKTFTYDGTPKTPSFRVIGNIGNGVVLNPASEYIYSYKNNIYPGTAVLNVKYTSKSRFKGARTEKFKIVPAKITDIKNRQTDTSVTFTFPAVKGATEYRLYGYDHDITYTGKDKYKVVGKSKSTTITVKNKKPGSEYWFYLRAYAVKNGKEIMLAKSDEFIRRTLPAKVTGAVSGTTEKNGRYTAVKSWEKSVRIGCNAVSGADGYYVYMYDSKSGKWKKVLNSEGEDYDKKTKKVYFLVEGLKPGTGYMFKIAAYRWRWDSPDSKGNLVGPKSQTIKASTVQNTKYRYVYKNNSTPYKIEQYYRVRLGGCSKSKGYYVILNKLWTNSKGTVYKPYRIIKTNKSLVNIDVPMRTSPNDPLYSITVKPYIEYGGKTFVGPENMKYGGNM